MSLAIQVAVLSVGISALVAWTSGHAPDGKPPPAAPSRARLFVQTLLVSFFVLYIGLSYLQAGTPAKAVTGGGIVDGNVAYDMQLGEPPF